MTQLDGQKPENNQGGFIRQKGTVSNDVDTGTIEHSYPPVSGPCVIPQT